MPYRTASHAHRLFCLLALLLLSFVATGAATAQTLAFTPGQYEIYAGNPVPPGGGGPSLSSSGYTGTAGNLVLAGPGNIAYDTAGNLYIMDQVDNILRVVAASNNAIPTLPGISVQSGHVYTVAGTTNPPGSSIPCSGGADVQGNGCPATVASFQNVWGIAVDKNGNVYFADYWNNQIRAIYGGAGGLPGISSPQQGYMYALTNTANDTTGTLRGENGPAGSAVVPYPANLAADSKGNIYFTSANDRGLRFIYNGGNLPSGFFPSGTTPTQGNEYLLTNGRGTCPNPTHTRTIGTRTILLSGACDGFPASEAFFLSTGIAIAIDASDNIYLQDRSSSLVHAIYLGGKLPGLDSSTLTIGNLYAVAGNETQGVPILGGLALQSPLFISGNYAGSNQAIAVGADGSLYFNGSVGYGVGQDKIFRVDPSGILTVVFGGNTSCAVALNTASGAPPVDQQLAGCASTSVPDLTAYGLAVTSGGNLYIANQVNAGANIIMESNVATSAIAYTGTIGLPIQNQTVTISNLGTQSLQLNNVDFTGPFSQVTTGGSNDCSASTSLASGASCQIGVSFLPTSAGTQSGTLKVTSNALNATGGSNIVSFSGVAAQASSSTKLIASPGGSVIANAGQAVTLTATVSPQPADTLSPGGTVMFMDGNTSLGSGTVNNGVATLTVTSLAAGTHAITAVYQGETNFSGSTSAPVNVTVSATPVALVTVSGSASSINSGHSVTFTANVAAFSSAGVPTGTVSFQDGANPLPNSTVTLSGGTATYTTSILPAGNNQIRAVYSGDSQFGANSSEPVSVQVNAPGLLQFTPGVISLVTGSYFTNNGAPANGTAANIAQFRPGNLAVDSYGNTYVIGPNAGGVYGGSSVWVTASGNGPIPGINSPQKGNIYLLGNATPCANYSTAPCGDGGPVTQAFFLSPSTLAVDALNNIYVVDRYEIRKISALSGTVTDIGGTYGTYGYGGDNGPATAATVRVAGMFADLGGNIYIADGSDALVRRIDGQTGIISTIAGQPPIDLNTPTQCAAVPCGDGGLATAAGLINPVGIFVDQANNVYFGEDGNDSNLHDTKHVIRKIDGQSGIISLYAGMYNSPNQTYFNQCDPQEQMPCGDGGLATSASLNNVSAITGDVAGNVYVADNNTVTVRRIDARTGIIDTVAGNMALAGNSYDPLSNACATSNVTSQNPPCGDGLAATAAFLNNPSSIAIDPQGNLYIADKGTDVVREVSGASSAMAFGSQTLGTFTPLTVTLTNSGSQPLTLSDINVPMNYVQQASGSSDCTGSMTLTPGGACALDIAFFPTATGSLLATLTITSNAANATNGQNVIALSGTGVSPGGTTAQTITFNPPAGPFYEGEQIPLTATATSGLNVDYLVTSGSGIILNNGTASAALKITGAGNVTVTAYQFGDSQYAQATPVAVSLLATQPVLTITATSPSLVVGSALPVFTGSAYFTVSGLIPGDAASVVIGQPAFTVQNASGATVPVGATLEAGTYTVVIAQGTLSFPSYYKPSFVNGTLTVTGTNRQTVSFTGLPATATYNAATTYSLIATALDATTGQADGLPITYSVTGPATVSGDVLTVNGAGTVTVTATQAGSGNYSSASASQTIQVAKATLTVTAVSLTYAQGVALPALTSSSNYTITGLAPGDNLTAITGQPALSIVDTKGITGTPGAILAAGAMPPAGVYTINISAGFLAATNYNFNFVPGTLTVGNGTAQTINFPPIPNVVYGAAPITLGATASSGLAVSYSVSPSNLAMLSGNVLTITGAGSVTLTATQVGNNNYAPAQPVQQTFIVAPAVLTVTANNATRLNNTPNPSFSYTFSGFVNGDMQGTAVSGTTQPVTTATTTSPVGQYPITFSLDAKGSSGLAAINYTFNYVPGVLTITSGGPVSGYTLTASPQSVAVTQGQIVQTRITLSPVNFYQGLVNMSCNNLPANVTCTFSPATLTANGNNEPVSTTLTINTNSASPVVGQLHPQDGSSMLAASFYMPGAMLGLWLALARKRRNIGAWQLLVVVALLSGAIGLTACGTSTKNNSSLAQTGSSTFTVTAKDSAGNVLQSITIGLTVR
ncbi:MAG TPA: Ig-like domain repeat protein [Acidisarcina sp.]|nr:Ig-like domain repeat protein [Acidisarcina sp.]